MNKNVERLYNGIIKENPTFVLMLGMCPTLAVTLQPNIGFGSATAHVDGHCRLKPIESRFKIPHAASRPDF